MIKKYTLFIFILVLTMAFLSPVLMAVPADYIVYFEYVKEGVNMGYTSFLDYVIFNILILHQYILKVIKL